ncbi:uncharacterized protein LOC112885736 isoform X2 [Panicum hallii]|uniref:uncharacterized protein LOC112885736 isoform X2 n=1 Tax=Panicum hallii TaxID=206008 RepID=UPI000DF4CEEE|nr:uncharacterized protein LOC112885736 isoform X2 [Panicum hallii]
MADHFVVMAGRLLTESTLQSAIDEASDAPSSTMTACDDAAVEEGRATSSVLVECRICQDDDDEAYMEAPCSCKGSLKYAHRKCIQRWCDEKGDTICEICLQLFQHGRNTIFFSAPGYIQARPYADQTSVTSTSYEYDRQTSTPTGVICCRIIAITLMVLLVLHDALSVLLGDQGAYTVAMLTNSGSRHTGVHHTGSGCRAASSAQPAAGCARAGFRNCGSGERAAAAARHQHPVVCAGCGTFNELERRTEVQMKFACTALQLYIVGVYLAAAGSFV